MPKRKLVDYEYSSDSNLKPLVKDVLKIFNSPEDSDFKVIVDNKEIMLHRLILKGSLY